MAYALGIDPNKVTDSEDDPEFALGQRGMASDGTEYVYLEADEAIGESDVVIVNTTDGGAVGLDTTSGAVATGTGAQLAVAPGSNRSQAIASGDFFWGCIFALGVHGVKVTAATECAAFTQLFATSTGGTVDDTLDLDQTVHGIVLTTAADTGGSAEVAAITYPVLKDMTDT